YTVALELGAAAGSRAVAGQATRQRALVRLGVDLAGVCRVRAPAQRLPAAQLLVLIPGEPGAPASAERDELGLELTQALVSAAAPAGAVAIVDVADGQRTQPSITEDEVRAIADLGRRVEEAFGTPMDVEWAIGPGASGRREIYLLQARPETVWSNRQATRPPAL